VQRHGRAIAGPYVSMCKDCIAATQDLLEGREIADPVRRPLFALNATVLHCAFCGHGPTQYGALVSSTVGRSICEECLDTGAMLGHSQSAG
jgi:ClpX C4-type zinc finger